MNNWIKRLCTAAFFPAALTCILLALWLFPPAVPVDNITPAEDIIRANIAWSGCFSQKQSLMSGMALRKLLRSSLRGNRSPAGMQEADYRAAILLCCGRVRLSMLSLR